jgi:deazaflavin-dependent oxidoreductase (nitroreductase family)
MMITDAAAASGLCLLETIGRVTGVPRVIEIWFAADPSRSRIYLLSGGRDRSHWVRNLRARPEVRVRLGGDWIAGHARIVDDGPEDLEARHLVAAKYQAWREGRSLSAWARESLPVAIDLSQ